MCFREIFKIFQKEIQPPKELRAWDAAVRSCLLHRFMIQLPKKEKKGLCERLLQYSGSFRWERGPNGWKRHVTAWTLGNRGGFYNHTTAEGALHETKDKRISGLSNQGRATTASSPLSFLEPSSQWKSLSSLRRPLRQGQSSWSWFFLPG